MADHVGQRVQGGEYDGFTIRGGTPDRCWLPGDWSSDTPYALLQDEEGRAFYRSVLAFRGRKIRRELQRDIRVPFLVKVGAL